MPDRYALMQMLAARLDGASQADTGPRIGFKPPKHKTATVGGHVAGQSDAIVDPQDEAFLQRLQQVGLFGYGVPAKGTTRLDQVGLQPGDPSLMLNGQPLTALDTTKMTDADAPMISAYLARHAKQR